MKKLASVLLPVLLLLGVAPWGLGHMARVRVDRGIDMMLDTTPYIRIVSRNWKSGWFHSEQTLTCEVVLPGSGSPRPAALHARAYAASTRVREVSDAAPGSLFQFVIRNDVQHGPLPGGRGFGLAQVNTRVVLSDKVRQKVIDLLGTDEPIHVRTVVGFIGGGTTTVYGEAHRIPLDKLGPRAGAGAISWDAFALSVSTSSGGNAYKMHGNQPRIEINDSKSGTQVVIEDTRLDGSGERITGDVFSGDALFAIRRIRVVATRTPGMEVEDIRYEVNSARKGEFLDYALKLGTGPIKSKSLDASGIQITQIHYDFTLQHLYLQSLQGMMTALKDARDNPGQGDATNSSLRAIRKEALELIKHDPEFVIDRIGFVTPEGEGLLKGVVRFEGVTDQDVETGMTSLIRKISADLDFEVAQAVIGRFPNSDSMVKSATDSGYVQIEAGKLVSHIQFRHGELTINGKPQRIPLPGAATADPR